MKISKELLKGSTSTMVLKIIAEKDAYGYSIVRELARRSGDLFHLNEGTLYPILHALEEEGYVESYRRATEAGRERRYYRITCAGTVYLKTKLDEWKIFSGSVDKILQEDE